MIQKIQNRFSVSASNRTSHNIRKGSFFYRTPETTMEAESTSAMDRLSPDCRNNVFLFLSLKDCLRFAGTSSTSLEHVIAEVQRRRHEQFLTRPCEELIAHNESPTLPFSVRESSLPPNAELVPMNTAQYPHLHSLERKDGRRLFYALPTIEERIRLLYARLPRTHPFNDDLKNLVQDLKKKFPSLEEANPTRQKGQLLKLLSSVTYAHRLHASLLSRCTTQLDPADHHGSYPSENVFNTSLDQYVGDVMSARILVGHTYCDHQNEAGIRQWTTTGVEGGPSMEKWIHSLESGGGTWGSDIGAKDWYKYWVFYHSTFLRIAPMSVEQAEHLRLLPFSGVLEPFPAKTNISNSNASNNNHNNNEDSVKEQHLHWFVPSSTYARFPRDDDEQRTRLTSLMRLRNAFTNLIRHGFLEMTYYDFGPLGPSFRGRDSVQTKTMRPKMLFPATIDAMCNRDECYVTNLVDWLEERSIPGRIMQWMRLLQDQCQKNRPMTVRSPFVTIRVVTSSA